MLSRRTPAAWLILGVVAMGWAGLHFSITHRDGDRTHEAPESACTGDPLPPDLLDIATLPGSSSGETELIVTTRPQASGRLEVQVYTEGAARLAPEGKASEAWSGASTAETRRYRVQTIPAKAGAPAPAAIVEATLVVDAVAQMGRSYRVPLAPETRGRGGMPAPISDGRGGLVRVFPGAAR